MDVHISILILNTNLFIIDYTKTIVIVYNNISPLFSINIRDPNLMKILELFATHYAMDLQWTYPTTDLL